MTVAFCQRVPVWTVALLGLALVGCATPMRSLPIQADTALAPRNELRTPLPNIAAAALDLAEDQTQAPGSTGPDAATQPDLWAELEVRLRRDVTLALDDYRHFYSPGNLAWTGLGLGLSATLAHTPADRSIRDWYQGRVHGRAIDRLADVVNVGGQLWVVWPVCMEALALMGRPEDDYFLDGGTYEWSNRSLRAIAVGFPPVVVLYGLLGSGRPDRGDSRWHPFRDIRGVSGHTFTGAIPFLTAAAMTDNPVLQASLFAGSMATGWSRLHKDRHYMSQIMLGWWMAYFSVRSVGTTQDAWRAVSIGPTFIDGPALGVRVRY